MNKITFVIIGIVLVIGLTGCSRKKDKFINRNWHAVTTEYNTLYNGDLALDLGKKQIAEGYLDNFWEILPVERMQVSDEITLEGTVKNESFKIAEEKATKAIQRHSMLIGGKEKNPQIDEAFLMLGKARYYDQRFIPALEAFNYILYKYPASNTINHAQIWREKTNLRLENDQLAIKNLKKLIKTSNLNDQDNADAHATLAQAYIYTNSLDSAAVAIGIAAEYTKKNEEEGRYHFIEGQLFNRLENRENATLAFEKVIELNRKIPREYLINARLERARNFNFNLENPAELQALLEEMEEDRENRPFLDKIHFQLAEYYNHLDSTAIAIKYYNKSLKSPVSDNFLKSVNYETLGNIYFDKKEYRVAGAYYDSTLTKIPNTTKDFFVIQRKRDNLQEVILFEEIADKNDSVLRFVGMNDVERREYFIQYTNQLKSEAVIQAQQGIVTEPSTPLPVRRSPGAPPSLGSASPGNTFYFYNPNRVATGMAEFLRTWGPRELRDNWRTDPGNLAATRVDGLDEVSELIIANNPQFNPQTYLDKIPSDPVLIDSLKGQRDNAYFRLGLIYKEKFRENQLATQRLTKVLNLTSEERLIAPSAYYLYQIYKEEGNLTEAEKYRNRLFKDYPDSRYTASIRNPGKAIEMEDSPQESYNKLYALFEQGQFQQVLQTGEEYIDRFRSDEVLPKIELLTAMAKGRLLGYEPYKKALGEIALNYPQTEEGKRAQQLLNVSLPNMSSNTFNQTAAQVDIKILYKFPLGDSQEVQAFKETIDKAIKDVGYKKLTTSIDVYDPENSFVVVHGNNNMDQAKGFSELLQINKLYNITREPVFISSENYRVVQLHKNLEAYKMLSTIPKTE